MLLASQILRKAADDELVSDIRVPKTWYIASDGLQSFAEHNQLEDVYNRKYLEIDQVRREYPHIVQVFKNSSFAPDILAGLVARRGSAAHPVIVGFAAETGDESGSVLDLARAKLARKGCDLLVANEVGATKTFGQDTNTVHLLFRDGRPGVTVGPASKAAVADAVWDGIRDLIPASH